MSQSYTIVEIGRAGSMSVNLLTEILGVDKSTVSKSIDKLVNNGIMVRDADLQDRRSVILCLGDTGQSVFDGIEKQSTAYFEGVLVDIPDDKREQIIESMQYLVKSLKDPRCC